LHADQSDTRKLPPIMAAKVILTAKQNSFKFSDRVLSLEDQVIIGRAGGSTSSHSDNAFFDSKVLSKSHAKLMYQDSKIFIIDNGSSNGTFVNNIRLSKAGRQSDPVEVFTGDMLKFGSEVEDKNKKVVQKPVVSKVTILKDDKVEYRERSPASMLFRPADSQEDVTMVEDDDKCSLSRESMVMLKEKLLEMQRGMEFLTCKEKDYEELQMLAEEEAETICELEKENYKLKHTLNNIENKIAHEKEKYMKLAQYEAETICSLEKENYKLIESLNIAEESLTSEREKNKILLLKFEAEKKDLESKLQEDNVNALNEYLNNPNKIELDAAALKLQDLEHLEATESDYDLITEDELNTLTESRRNSQVVDAREEATAAELLTEQGKTNAKDVGNKTKPIRPDFIVLMIVAWLSFMVGFLMEDFLLSAN